MALLQPLLSHLLVRWVHVLGMAALFGGAVLVWGVLRLDEASEDPPAGLRVAATYEWLFWAGLGLLVLTGVGNLGSMAPAIPGPETRWGAAFATKLLGVFGLLIGSLIRTLGVVGVRSRRASRLSPRVFLRLRAGYAATAVLLLSIVALAEVLAHG